MKKRYWLMVCGILVLVASLLLPACAPEAPPEEVVPPEEEKPPLKPTKEGQWAEVEAKAREEGELLLYSTCETETFLPLATEFMKREYGIELDNIMLHPGESVPKLKAEAAADTHMADVAHLDLLNMRDNPEYFDEWGYIPNVESVEAEAPFDIHAYSPGIIYQTSISSVTTNTDLVPPGTEPKTWKEMADPKWRGMIVMDDPTLMHLSNRLIAHLTVMYGEEWLRTFLKNDVIIAREIREVPSLLVRGEYAIYIACTMFGALRMQEKAPGIPTKFYVPDEGALGLLNSFQLVKNAPHPNAAKVFLNWALSREGQEANAKAYAIPLRGGFEVAYPQWQDPANIKYLPPFPQGEDYWLKDLPRVMKLCEEIMAE